MWVRPPPVVQMLLYPMIFPKYLTVNGDENVGSIPIRGTELFSTKILNARLTEVAF